MCNLLGFLILIAVLFAVFYRSGLRPITDFPVLAAGHTAVHLVDQHGNPFAPAYMTFIGNEPRFYKLYTNESIGSYTDYTRFSRRSTAYRAIRTSTPLYRGYSLYRILYKTKPLKLTHPTIKQIYEERKRVWWERCVRNWEEFQHSRR